MNENKTGKTSISQNHRERKIEINKNETKKINETHAVKGQVEARIKTKQKQR